MKVPISLKPDKNKEYFRCRPMIFLVLSRSVLRRMRNVSGKFVEKIKIRTLYPKTYFDFFFRKSCHIRKHAKNDVQ